MGRQLQNYHMPGYTGFPFDLSPYACLAFLNTFTFLNSTPCGYWKVVKGEFATRAFGYRGKTLGALPARRSMEVITKPMIAK